MNPGYQQGQGAPQGYPPPPPPSLQPHPPVNIFQGNRLLLVAAILLGVFVLCSWLVGAFNLDGDAGRFFRHTGAATATAGLGLLLLTAFHRVVEKDREHPVGFGVALVVCALLLAVVGMGGLLSWR